MNQEESFLSLQDHISNIFNPAPGDTPCIVKDRFGCGWCRDIGSYIEAAVPVDFAHRVRGGGAESANAHAELTMKAPKFRWGHKDASTPVGTNDLPE